MSEHDHQVALFKWARLHTQKYPGLGLLAAVPNGGHRHKAVAGKLKAEGVRAGFPDIVLPVARRGFHGMYIELKKPKDRNSGAGRMTKYQREWQEALLDQGYFAVCCTGFEAAIGDIEWYYGDD